MRISEIKDLSADPKVKRLFSYFWESKPYRVAMAAYSRADCTVYDLYGVIVSVFLDSLEQDPQLLRSGIKKDVGNLSRQLYGDPYCWSDGTKWAFVRESERLAKERARKKAERNERLRFLYDRLELSSERRDDIVKYLGADEKLGERILAMADSVMTRDDLYEVCLEVLLPRIRSDEFRFRDFRILCSVSVIAHGNPAYFAESNALSFEQIKSRFSGKKNGTATDAPQD